MTARGNQVGSGGGWSSVRRAFFGEGYEWNEAAGVGSYTGLSGATTMGSNGSITLASDEICVG